MPGSPTQTQLALILFCSKNRRASAVLDGYISSYWDGPGRIVVHRHHVRYYGNLSRFRSSCEERRRSLLPVSSSSQLTTGVSVRKLTAVTMSLTSTVKTSKSRKGQRTSLRTVYIVVSDRMEQVEHVRLVGVSSILIEWGRSVLVSRRLTHNEMDIGSLDKMD